MRLLMPGEVSFTSVLSKVLVDLATGDGNALQGEDMSGIEAGGCMIRSVANRRLGEFVDIAAVELGFSLFCGSLMHLLELSPSTITFFRCVVAASHSSS